MLAAVALEIENPYWAAMTALIVIQPTRGLLFEKSFYRLVRHRGRLGGRTTAPAAHDIPAPPHHGPRPVGCRVRGAGNLCYGLRSYAFLMAACTAPVIVLSAYQTPSHLFEIAFGRVACIIVGIIVATAVTALFTPRQSKKEVVTRVRRVAGETVAWLSLSLREGRSRRSVRLEQELLIAIAEIESLLDEIGAGRSASSSASVISEASSPHSFRCWPLGGWPANSSAATMTGIFGTESGGNVLPGIWTGSPPVCQIRRSD